MDYRLPYNTPVPGWPVAVRSAGRAVVGGRFVDAGRRRDVLMVVWSLSGLGRYRTGGGDQALPAGSWLWVPPGTTYDLAAAARGWELRWLTVDGPAVAAWTAGWSPPPVPCQPAQPLDVASHDHLLAAVGHPTPARLLACLEAATALLVAGLHAAGPDDLCNRAIVLIEHHGTDPLFDVAALARALGCHRSHLARCCAARVGTGPKDLICQRRVRHARELWVEDPGLSVAEVARRVGFGGPDQLARAFQRISGVTPTVWRRGGRFLGAVRRLARCRHG